MLCRSTTYRAHQAHITRERIIILRIDRGSAYMDGSASNEVVLRGLCKRGLLCAARAGAACDARPVQARLAMRGPCRRGLRCAARADATCDARPVLVRLAGPLGGGLRGAGREAATCGTMTAPGCKASWTSREFIGGSSQRDHCRLRDS